MFYLLKLAECPEIDDKFTTMTFERLDKTEQSERRVSIFPIYSDNGPAMTKCYCNGNIKINGKLVDVLFERNENADGCHLKVRTDQVNEEDMETIRNYFGVKEEDIEESDT